MFIKFISTLLCFLTCFLVGVAAQTETGSISGIVVDQQGAVIAGVGVKLTSASTAATREVSSDEHGNFSFNAVPPGTYHVAIEQSGFKRYEKTNVNLEANGHLALGKIQLQVGAVSDVVTVTAEGALLQTASSERSGIITAEQVEHLTVINRDFTFLASLQPGIVANTSADSQGFRGGITFNANGGRTGQNNITLDGVPLENSNTNNMNTFISMDAISTVKIESSGYQAEFGRKPGAAIQAVTKSGSVDYHGTVYWYQRNEAFNASGFFNKARKLQDPPYRYISAGASFGGPVYIPKLVHRGQKKLFFFFNEEQQRELRPQDQVLLIVPTPQERNGDFSGKPLSDPKNCGTTRNQPCLTDSTHINPNMIDPNMKKYLNLFPLPLLNTPLPPGSNFQFQESNRIPKHNEVARIDYMLSPKTTIYGVFNYWSEEEIGNNVPAGSTKWGWLPATYAPKSRTLNLAGTHSFSPTLFLEVSMAGSRWTEAAHPQQKALDAKSRSVTGINLFQFHPEINPLNLLPQSSFGGLTNPPNVTYDGRFPIRGVENVLTWTATVTKVQGRHTAKAGIFIEHWRQVKGENGNFAGTLNFDSKGSGFTTAGGNTGNAFANALLGNFFTYTESTTRPPLYGRYNGIEWFVQDNWKVSSKLVLDLGLRFGWSQPFHSSDLNEAGFVPERFDPGKAVRLIESTTKNCGSFGSPCGVDPGTGKVFPKFAIGAIVPNVGDPNNGTVNRVQNPSYPQGLRENSGVRVGPRFGFAYDPFAKGNTVIRGGFGMFYDFRERDNFYVNISKTPPLQLNPVIQSQNISGLPSAGSFMFPSDTLSLEKHRSLPHVMEFSLGIQQNIGFKTVADIAYVGSLGRHLLWRRNLNAIPYGTVAPGSSLPSSLFRFYKGYGDILESEYAATSNYHSLQVAVNRRFAKSLQFGVAWTWSKAMDFVDSDGDQISSLVDPRIWNYGKAGFDRTHILKASFTWDLPKLSRRWDNSFARVLLDDWTISGIPTFQSGAPHGITINSSNNTLSLSPTDGARVIILHSPTLPKDQRTVEHYFDVTAFDVPVPCQRGTPPPPCTPGNAPKDVFRGPGINNWDLSLFKNIPLPGERMHLQFRAEAYNALNHTQFSTIDTTARMNTAGKLTTMGNTFGQVTAARANRRMQLALRLSF
jgi:hypothetical protein